MTVAIQRVKRIRGADAVVCGRKKLPFGNDAPQTETVCIKQFCTCHLILRRRAVDELQQFLFACGAATDLGKSVHNVHV